MNISRRRIYTRIITLLASCLIVIAFTLGRDIFTPFFKTNQNSKETSFSQQSSNYVLTASIFSKGGANSTGGNYQLSDSLGQAIDSGYSNSENYQLLSGPIPLLYPNAPSENENSILTPIDNEITVNGMVTVTGLSSANASITLSVGENSFETTASETGSYSFIDIGLIMGPNVMTSQSVDAYGQIVVDQIAVTRTIYLLTGTLESRIHDAGQSVNWLEINWVSETPPGTTIQVRTRSGETATPDETWSDWSNSYVSGEMISSPAGRYLQYEAVFNTTDQTATPILDEVNVNYENEPATLSIVRQSDDILLSWSSVGNAVSYKIYRDSNPYFTPNEVYAEVTDLSFLDFGVGSDELNHFYFVTAVDQDDQPVQTLNRVGKFIISLQPNWNLVTIPFVTNGISLDEIFGDQLFGTADPQTADRILIWDNLEQTYESAWFCGGEVCETFGPDFYNHWLANDFSQSNLTLTLNDGFWLQNRSGGLESLVIIGGITEEPQNVTINNGWQLLGSAFPISIGLDEAGIPANGTEDPLTADRILYWDNIAQTYESAWFCGGEVCETFGPDFYNHWLANDFSQSNLTIEEGHGFWYLNRQNQVLWENMLSIP